MHSLLARYLKTITAISVVLLTLGAAPPAYALVCGDSEPDPGEECDDGNTTSGDGCSATCTLEPGFECTDAIAGQTIANILLDGSFEDGNAGGEWTSINHSLFGPDLICGDSCFGTPFAAGEDGSLVSGNYVLVAGGSFTSNSTGNVTHAPVAIPANATTLQFQWATLASGPDGDPCAGAADGLALSIAGTQVWSNLDGPVNCTNVTPYERVVIDLATAAGGPYQGTTVDFEFTGDATGIPPNVDLTNVMLDDVSLIEPLVPPIPPTPSMCTAIVCGDGILGTGEQCDDGNLAPGDGCDASCKIEQPNFVCRDPQPPAPSGENVIDGGLEEGFPNQFWAQTSTVFDPICSQALCGSALANEGAFFGWFGGTSSPHDQTLTQDVQISSTATDLTFDLLVGICDSANDSLTVEIDGTEIYRYDCTVNTATYEPQSAALGAFADGAVHTLQFIGHTVGTNAGSSNFFVDNISVKDNVAFAGTPSVCIELPTACNTPEQFTNGIPAGWTVVNLGDDAADGWGTSDDGICASQNWGIGEPFNNATDGGGPAACADSDATGQIDLDGGAPAPNEMDTYLCTPTLDISQVTDPVFSFLVNYQAADNRLNDNGTPGDASDDFDDDFLRILVGDVAPNAQSVPNYTDLGSVFDHLDSSLALSKPGPFSASLAAQNALAAAHVCFNYRGTYAWFAQIDNAALRGSSCDAAPDADADGVPDSTDNCTDVANPLQIDSNGDGIGNICDADLNDDCNVNFLDLGIMKSVFFTNDPDADLVGAGNSESDGVVNFFDLGKMKELFFQAPGPSAAGCN